MTAAQTKAGRLSQNTAGNGAFASNQQPSKASGRSGRSRNQLAGVMVKIRLLPPAMQQVECLKLLPEQWHVGHGKVDSFRYTQGKTSSRPGRPSHASVAYLHLSKEEDITTLGETVKQVAWEDGADSFNDSCLKAKPYVERCIYRKTPAEKDRGDPLQGTIDQDPEFISFLENLTRVATREKEEETPASSSLEAEKSAEKSTISTPLVEYMREKRDKDKETSGLGRNSRNARQDGKSATKLSNSGDKKRSRDKERDGGKEKEKAERMSEKVKILKKPAATTNADKDNAGGKNATTTNASTSTSEQSNSKTKRASIAAAARLLQRDHGMSPGAAHRQARAEIAKAESESKAAASSNVSNKKEAAKESQPLTNASKPTDGAASSSKRELGRTRGRGRGKRGGDPEASKAQQAPTKPIILLKKKPEVTADSTSVQPTPVANDGGSQTTSTAKRVPETPIPTPITSSKTKTIEKSNNNPSNSNSNKERKSDKPDGKTSGASSSLVTAGVTHGFVKHVNVSQGVNESSLRTALSCFGALNSIDIDRRKGFAYVEFSQHESLVAAVKAGQISIGQGQVQVVERKDKKPVTTSTSSGAHGPSNGPSASGGPEKAASKEPAKPKGGDIKEGGERSEKSGSRRSRGRRGGGGKKDKDAGRGGNEAGAGGDKAGK
ncbi:hypothetical protein BROUX41_000464 [Berkeleyomyces rouxiae]